MNVNLAPSILFSRDKHVQKVHHGIMKQPEFLAAKDINSRAERLTTVSIPASTGNPVLDANLYDLSQRFCGEHSPDTVLQMLATVMNAAQSPLAEHDLQCMNRAIDEMFTADKMFHPYRNVRKITCFGSARIHEGEPSYELSRNFSRLAARRGYMIITGGGPGIMQACNEGAGKDLSFGLNITLPYEQHANHVVAESDKMMSFYYFFTRKLNFLKQTDALVAFPGGFGTMDEIYETITLIQTGKSTIFPIVLLDPPGKTFWGRWVEFVNKELLESGLISPEDMKLLYVSKDEEDALRHIEHFYSRYHSYYFDDDLITIRLMELPSSALLKEMCRSFTDIIPLGDLSAREDDTDDHEPMLATLPRIRFTLRRGNYARLRELIDFLNT